MQLYAGLFTVKDIIGICNALLQENQFARTQYPNRRGGGITRRNKGRGRRTECRLETEGRDHGTMPDDNSDLTPVNIRAAR
jgi:hypothetical protein